MKARSRSSSIPTRRFRPSGTQKNAPPWTKAAVLRELNRLAQQLWTTGIHEARVLATLIGEPEKVTAAEMDRWSRDFDSWDVVDAACRYLYSDAKPAWEKIYS